MKAIPTLLSAGGLLLVSLTAHASKSYDCRHYGDGEGILTNVTKRFWNPSTTKEHLQAHVLHITRLDADASKNIALSSLALADAVATGTGGGGANCQAVRAAAEALGRNADLQMGAIDSAKIPCTTFPDTPDKAEACVPKARDVFKHEREAGKKGGLLERFITAVKANPGCSTLDFNDQAKIESDTPEAVFFRLQRQPCNRDDRCSIMRVGQIRRAREELSKIEAGGKDPAPAELLAAWHWVKPLLFKQNGEATDAPFPEENGAENLLWHLTTYNTYWNGNADDPTINLFVGAQKVAQSALILNEGGKKAQCPEY